MQETILSDEFEDSSGVGDKESVLRVFLENEPQALLLLWVRRLICWTGIAISRLLDLRFIEEHQVLDLELDQIMALFLVIYL